MEESERGLSRRPLSEDDRSFLEGLDTGDLVLFDRPCLKMGSLLGAAVCFGAKAVSGCPFDHVGVVVRREDGVNMLVEASFSGVQARPLCERILRSSASQICVRKLETNRTEAMRASAREFVAEIAHLPYKAGTEGMLQMASVGLRLRPEKEHRRRLHAQAIKWAMAVARLELELKRLAGEEAESDAHVVVRGELERALVERDRSVSLLATSLPTDWPSTGASVVTDDSNNGSLSSSLGMDDSGAPPRRSSSESATTGTRSQPPREIEPDLRAVPSTANSGSEKTVSSGSGEHLNSYEKDGLFCSELVAALYQRLGLLDAPFPSSSDYVPADFAQALTGGDANDVSDVANVNDSTGHHARVALLRGAVLGPGRWIRGEPRKRKAPPSFGAGSWQSKEWKKREAGVMSSEEINPGGRGSQQVSPWAFGSSSCSVCGDAVRTEFPVRYFEERVMDFGGNLDGFSDAARGGVGRRRQRQYCGRTGQSVDHDRISGSMSDVILWSARPPVSRRSLREARAEVDHALQNRPLRCTELGPNAAGVAPSVPSEPVAVAAVGGENSSCSSTRAAAKTTANACSPQSRNDRLPLLIGASPDLCNIVGVGLGAAGLLTSVGAVVKRHEFRRMITGVPPSRAMTAAAASVAGVVAIRVVAGDGENEGSGYGRRAAMPSYVRINSLLSWSEG